MAFNPEAEYHIETVPINVRHLHAYRQRYIVRPPYQRKTVWETGKKQALLDSLFRRYFIPSIVIREVRLDQQSSRREVIDGQQRISTIQEFYDDKLTLPDSLKDVDVRLPGKRMSELDDDIREFIDEELRFNAEIIKNIQDPKNDRHLEIASKIFWRLQQGESLNKIETAHSRLASPVRNFLVKYADDYDFDHITYTAIEPNPHKHVFFREIYTRTNTRMQHLGLLGNFLLLEIADGPTKIGDTDVAKLIEDSQQEQDGIGNLTYEKEDAARATLRHLNRFHEVFQDDPTLDKERYGVGAICFRHEYFTVSCYLLLRHLIKHYVYSEDMRLLFRQFVYDFFRRTQRVGTSDESARNFVENRQQNRSAVGERERIIRFEFFNYADQSGHKVIVQKDDQRAFSEAQRLGIYIRDQGICQMCVEEGKPDRECIVPWSEFEADHVLPHSKGGQTLIENGQVLCREHNRQKGAGV